jgi:hypothetical protein
VESFWAPSCFNQHEPHPAQLRFEATRVEMVLRAFRLQDHAAALVRDYKKRWRVPRLTFESFHRFFPTFPFMMEAQSLYRTGGDSPAMTLGGLFTSFPEHFIVRRYEALRERYRRFSDPRTAVLSEPVPPAARGLPLAMPFPCGGVRGGLVLHDRAEPLTTGPKVTLDYYDEELAHFHMWVEPFGAWLEALAALGWAPDAPPARRRRPRPVVRRGAIVRPWMAEACGGVGPDTYLLGWLLRILRRGATPYEQTFRVRRPDGVWVAFCQKALAPGLGISPDQLRRALRKLCRRGLVERGRGPGRGLHAVTHARPIWDRVKAAAAEAGAAFRKLLRDAGR